MEKFWFHLQQHNHQSFVSLPSQETLQRGSHQRFSFSSAHVAFTTGASPQRMSPLQWPCPGRRSSNSHSPYLSPCPTQISSLPLTSASMKRQDAVSPLKGPIEIYPPTASRHLTSLGCKTESETLAQGQLF